MKFLRRIFLRLTAGAIVLPARVGGMLESGTLIKVGAADGMSATGFGKLSCGESSGGIAVKGAP